MNSLDEVVTRQSKFIHQINNYYYADDNWNWWICTFWTRTVIASINNVEWIHWMKSWHDTLNSFIKLTITIQSGNTIDECVQSYTVNDNEWVTLIKPFISSKIEVETRDILLAANDMTEIVSTNTWIGASIKWRGTHWE